MMEFVGREAELKRFEALLKGTTGALWAIRGEGGLGKSWLLRQFRQRCEQKKREFLFIDVEQLSTYKTAAEFLLRLSVANLPSFAPTVQKAKGVYETLKMQLETGLKTFAPELQAAGTAFAETYVKEEYEKQFAAVADKYLSTLLSTISKVFNAKTEKEKKAIAENVEAFLMAELKKICKKHPVILVDTYEHLDVKAFLKSQQIESQLTNTFEVASDICVYPLKNWINRWLDFLSEQGAVVIVAGREFEIWKLEANNLPRFKESEIKQVVFNSKYAEICAIRDTTEQLAALLAVLNKLSFEGSPLWLVVGLNLVAQLLKEGQNIVALAQEDETLKRCFEQIDGTLDPSEIKHANCKMAIFRRITRQFPDELIENAWRLALPRYLDREILQLLLNQSAEPLIELYKNLQILSFKRSEQRFFLHESIRDLLIHYAKHKSYWQSDIALKLHGQLAALFEQRAKTKAVFLEKIEVEYLELTLAEEMYFHRHQGQEFDLKACMGVQYDLAEGCQQIKENDKDELGWSRLGYALFYLNRYGEAIASYDKALALQPDDASAWYNRGVVLINLNRYEEAIVSYDKALAFKPDYADAWSNRGIAFDNLNRNEEAIASYDKALAFKPDYADAWNNRGIALINLNRPEEAIASYDKALAFKPDYATAWNNRGYALGNLNRYEEAIASFDKVLALQPDDANAWHYRGITLRNLNRYEEAIASFDKVLALQPDDANAWHYRGITLRNLNRYEEAIASFDKVLAFKPDHANAWFNRGYALINLNRPEEAIASYDKALAFKPDYADAWNNRGIALRNLNRAEEAIASYDKALAFKPDDASAWSLRGIALFNLNRYAEAIDSYEIALSYSPNNVDILEIHGVTFIKLGIYSKAAQSFAQVLTIQANRLSTLTEDIELALIQNDFSRIQQRLAVALPLLKNNTQEFIILPFLQWLAIPQSSLQPLLTAIQNLAPDVKINWDFSDTQPAIRRLSPAQQAIAQHFINYFQGTIDFITLQQELRNHD